MYNLLVLGLVPGTNIQITFELWLQAMGLLIVIVSLTWLLRNRVHVHHALLEVHEQLVPDQYIPLRVTMHARQLHR